MRKQGIFRIFPVLLHHRSAHPAFSLFPVPIRISKEPQTGKNPERCRIRDFWQGHKDLNPEPTVLETAALPIELYPYMQEGRGPEKTGGPSGIRTRDDPVMSRRL